MLAAMIGCGDSDDNNKAVLISSIPASGDEITVGDNVVLLFDNPPGTVTVNNRSTTDTGTAAIWQALGITPGQQVKFEVKWDTGRTILTFGVKAKENGASTDNEPPFVVEISLPLSRCRLLYTKNVTSETGRAICDQDGLFFCGEAWPQGIPGLQASSDRYFDLRPSFEVPFNPALKYQSNDTLVVDTRSLNADGIAIRFSEPIQKGEFFTHIKDGIGRNVYVPFWWFDSLWLVPGKVQEFDNDTTYILEITVPDDAGNQLRAKIQFHTNP